MFNCRAIPISDELVLCVETYVKDIQADKFSQIYNCVKVERLLAAGGYWNRFVNLFVFCRVSSVIC